jgi:hypothetical protein
MWAIHLLGSERALLELLSHGDHEPGQVVVLLEVLHHFLQALHRRLALFNCEEEKETLRL